MGWWTRVFFSEPSQGGQSESRNNQDLSRLLVPPPSRIHDDREVTAKPRSSCLHAGSKLRSQRNNSGTRERDTSAKHPQECCSNQFAGGGCGSEGVGGEVF